MPEIVTVKRGRDLRPFDQVAEGLFIAELVAPTGSTDWGQWTVAPLCFVEEMLSDGQTYKRPQWGEPVEVPMDFPMQVVRGLEPPLCTRRDDDE